MRWIASLIVISLLGATAGCTEKNAISARIASLKNQIMVSQVALKDANDSSQSDHELSEELEEAASDQAADEAQAARAAQAARPPVEEPSPSAPQQASTPQDSTAAAP